MWRSVFRPEAVSLKSELYLSKHDNAHRERIDTFLQNLVNSQRMYKDICVFVALMLCRAKIFFIFYLSLALPICRTDTHVEFEFIYYRILIVLNIICFAEAVYSSTHTCIQFFRNLIDSSVISDKYIIRNINTFGRNEIWSLDILITSCCYW